MQFRSIWLWGLRQEVPASSRSRGSRGSAPSAGAGVLEDRGVLLGGCVCVCPACPLQASGPLPDSPCSQGVSQDEFGPGDRAGQFGLLVCPHAGDSSRLSSWCRCQHMASGSGFPGPCLPSQCFLVLGQVGSDTPTLLDLPSPTPPLGNPVPTPAVFGAIHGPGSIQLPWVGGIIPVLLV